MIEIVDKEISDKFYRLMELLDYIDFDLESKTITFKGDITFKIEGNYSVSSDKHISLSSNKDEIDQEKDIPYSVLINCQ